MTFLSRITGSRGAEKSTPTAQNNADTPVDAPMCHGKLGARALVAGGEASASRTKSKGGIRRFFKKHQNLEEKAEHRLSRAWGKGKLASKSVGGMGLYRQNSLTDLPATTQAKRRSPARVLEETKGGIAQTEAPPTPFLRPRRSGWESPVRSPSQAEDKSASDTPRNHVLRRASSYEQALETQNAFFTDAPIATNLRRTDSYAEAMEHVAMEPPPAPAPATKNISKAMLSLAGLPSHALGAEIEKLEGITDVQRLDLQAARSYGNILEADRERIRDLTIRLESGDATATERNELAGLLRRHLDALSGIQRHLDNMLLAHLERDDLAVETEAMLRTLGNSLAEEHMALADVATHLSDLLPETHPGNALDKIDARILDLRGARHAINERYHAMELQTDPQSLLDNPRVQQSESLAREMDERIASLEAQRRGLSGRALEGELAHLLRAPEESVDELASARTRLAQIFPEIPAEQLALSLQRGKSFVIAQQPWPIIDLEAAPPTEMSERLGETRTRIVPGKHLGGGAHDSYVVAGEPVNGLAAGDVNRYLGVPNLALSDLTTHASSEQEQTSFIALRHGFLDAPALERERLDALPQAAREQIASDLAPHAPTPEPGRNTETSLQDAAAFAMAKELAATQLSLDRDLRERALSGETVPLTLHSIALMDGGRSPQAKENREAWHRQHRALQRLENDGAPIELTLVVEGEPRKVHARVEVLQAGFAEEKMRVGRRQAYRMQEADAMMTSLLGSSRQREIGGKAAVEAMRLNQEIGALEREARWRVENRGRRSRFPELPYRQLEADLQERRQAREAIAQLSREVKDGWRSGVSGAATVESFPARVSLLLSLVGELPLVSSRDGLARVSEVDAAAKHLAATSSAQQEIPLLETSDAQFRSRATSMGLGRESEGLARLNRGLSVSPAQ